MNWDDVRFFLALDRSRTFKGAAELLRVHGSTVSRRLEQLEDEVGAALFDRGPDGPLPTPAADRIRSKATEAESCLMAIERDLHGWEAEVEGAVRVALLETLATHLVAPRIPELRRRHPRLTLVLVPGSKVLDLSRREADIALRLARPTSGDLVVREAGRTQLAVLGHRDRVVGLPSPAGPAELPWCAWEESVAPSPDVVWVNRHVPPEMVVFRSTHMDVLLRAVAAGAGVGLLPRELMEAYPTLVEVPVTVPLPPSIPMWLVCHRALRRVPRIAAVWDFLLEATAGSLSNAGPLVE